MRTLNTKSSTNSNEDKKPRSEAITQAILEKLKETSDILKKNMKHKNIVNLIDKAHDELSLRFSEKKYTLSALDDCNKILKTATELMRAILNNFKKFEPADGFSKQFNEQKLFFNKSILEFKDQLLQITDYLKEVLQVEHIEENKELDPALRNLKIFVLDLADHVVKKLQNPFDELTSNYELMMTHGPHLATKHIAQASASSSLNNQMISAMKMELTSLAKNLQTELHVNLSENLSTEQLLNEVRRLKAISINQQKEKFQELSNPATAQSSQPLPEKTGGTYQGEGNAATTPNNPYTTFASKPLKQQQNEPTENNNDDLPPPGKKENFTCCGW